ncbi:MAG: hypothetical protein R3B13_32055 [Polyangiaceae bacterium]
MIAVVKPSRRFGVGVALLALAALPGLHCSSEPAPRAQPRVCTPLSFRACEVDGCRGVEQCAADGRQYASCSCVITDASYGVDSGHDAADASDDAADTDAADASPDSDDDAGDVSADGNADAADAMDATASGEGGD